MADRIIKGDSGNDVIIQNNAGSRKIEVTNSGDVEVTGDVKTTTVKATNLKANDGTAGVVIADSTGEATGSGGFKAVNVKATNLKANDGTAALEIADSTGDIGFSGNTNIKIKLPSAGGIFESDGSTEILTESSGVVSLKNVLFPAGMIRQVVSTQATSQVATTNTFADIFTDLQLTTTGANKILVIGNINGIIMFDASGAIQFNLTDGSSSIQTLTTNYASGSNSADDPGGSFGFQHMTGVLSASTQYTFNVEMKNSATAASARVSGDSNSIRTLTLMEIVQ